MYSICLILFSDIPLHPIMLPINSWITYHSESLLWLLDMFWIINKMKDTNHVILSIYTGKAFDKIKHPFMIKSLSKVWIEKTHLNIVNAIYDKPTLNISLYGKKQKVFYLRSEMRQKYPLSPLLFSTGLETLTIAIR